MSLECPVILSCCEGRSVALLGRRAWNLVCIRALMGETFKVQSGLKYCESLCAVAALSLAQKHESSCTFPKTFFLWFGAILNSADVRVWLFTWTVLSWHCCSRNAVELSSEWNCERLSVGKTTCQMPSEDFCRHHADIYRENFLASSGRSPGIR